MDEKTIEIPHCEDPSMDVIVATNSDSTAPGIVMQPSQIPVRLDLGGGQNPAPGFDCVDLNAPNPKHRVDLWRFPWPFEDNSVDEIHCSHLIEHIPARDIEEKDINVSADRQSAGVIYNAAEREFIGKDMWLAFFDECWRIMKPGAFLKLIWPALQSVRAFQDPTHRRFIPLEAMSYLSADWRKANALDHYRVKCNFTGDLNFTTNADLALLHPEAQARHTKNYWNTAGDYLATIKALK